MQNENIKITNRNDFAKRSIRHGEVMIMAIDSLPEDLEEVYSGTEYVVGHSETGNSHIAVAGIGGTITMFKPAGADDGMLFMRVSKDSRVEHVKTHDKHETKDLFKGLYQITIKRAYDYFAKRLERVRD